MPERSATIEGELGFGVGGGFLAKRISPAEDNFLSILGFGMETGIETMTLGGGTDAVKTKGCFNLEILLGLVGFFISKFSPLMELW